MALVPSVCGIASLLACVLTVCLRAESFSLEVSALWTALSEFRSAATWLFMDRLIGKRVKDMALLAPLPRCSRVHAFSIRWYQRAYGSPGSTSTGAAGVSSVACCASRGCPGPATRSSAWESDDAVCVHCAMVYVRSVFVVPCFRGTMGIPPSSSASAIAAKLKPSDAAIRVAILAEYCTISELQPLAAKGKCFTIQEWMVSFLCMSGGRRMAGRAPRDGKAYMLAKGRKGRRLKPTPAGGARRFCSGALQFAGFFAALSCLERGPHSVGFSPEICAVWCSLCCCARSIVVSGDAYYRG